MNKFIAFLVILTFTASCTTEIEEMEQISLSEVDLLFSPQQTLSPDGSQFFLEMSNTEEINCSNSFYQIERDQIETLDETAFNLSINGVDTDGPCLSADDVLLTEIIDLPNSIMDFDFMITNKGVTNEGKLRLQEDRLSIAFLSTSGFEFDRLELKRVPQGIAWGSISLGQAERDIAAEFSLLQGEPDAVSSQLLDLQLDGDYGFFVINDWTDVIEINGESDFEQSFLLNIRNADDWVALQGLFSKIEQQFPGASYEVYNSDGEELRN